jgi:hypothetical protein
MKLLSQFGLGMALIALAGCATNHSSASWARTGDPLVDGRTAITQGPPKDKVLWEYRTALEALRRGVYGEAKALLDDALLTVGSITANDRGAKRSRSYFSEEAKKTFRGEPYERVMAYYYRGLLYWMDGESDNARACFRSAQIQDSDTENREYASDFVLLDYLDGFATTKLAGDGSDAYNRAVAVSRSGAPPPPNAEGSDIFKRARAPGGSGNPPPAYNPKANTLFFLEFGHGPTKFAAGEYGEQLHIRTHQSQARSAVIKVAGQTIQVGPYDDLNFQATTRGGRVMDHILANKAVFKTATDTVGNAALIGGAIAVQNRRSQEAGLGLLAFGLVSKIVAASTTPAADVRCWDGLPQYLSFASLELPPGQHTATIEFLDAGGQILPAFTKTAAINVSAQRDTVVFVSDQSHTSTNL